MSEMSKSQMLIGGEWLPPASKDYFESFNPYTGKPWKLIARGDAAVSYTHLTLPTSDLV